MSKHFGFKVFGIHHSNAPINIRESFSLSVEKQEILLSQFKSEFGSVIIISTCNRTEFWTQNIDNEALESAFLNILGMDHALFQLYKFEKNDEAALQHMFAVGCGLDSQILGDFQILAQVKQSAKRSESIGVLKSEMLRLLQAVYKVSKRVKNETEISEGAASVAFAAVQYILAKKGKIREQNILLYGTGKIGAITCQNLRKHTQESHLVLMNRTIDKAATLAMKMDAEVKDVEYLSEELEDADVVIVATGADKPTVSFSDIQKLKNNKKRLLIDLSVPRNIDPKIAELDNISIVDVDQLSHVQATAMEKRRNAVPVALEIISEGISEFKEWLNIRHLSPTFAAIKAKLHDFRQAEIAMQMHKLSPEEMDKIEGLTSSMVDKIARQFINHLKVHHNTQANPLHTVSGILDINA